MWSVSTLYNVDPESSGFEILLVNHMKALVCFTNPSEAGNLSSDTNAEQADHFLQWKGIQSSSSSPTEERQVERAEQGWRSRGRVAQNLTARKGYLSGPG